ncbi:hypothetical protein [Kitasatospora fiedleri]|uniref:hypothetical protein n=1 Tax=Kitasatospora fiedleri TaxID=2991545 RepID=UPI002499E8B8|nr:hypothetical protein [Kitasatospora fiedleri]
MSEKRFSIAAVVPDVNIRAETFYDHGLDQLDVMLYIHLRFKPHGTEFTADSLTAELQLLGWRGGNHQLISKRSVTASLRRLTGAKYIRKTQQHAAGGQFGAVSYEFFPVQQTGAVETANPQVAPFAEPVEDVSALLPVQLGNETVKAQVAPSVGDDRMRVLPSRGEITNPQVAPHVGDARMRATASDGDDRMRGTNPQVAPRAAIADMRSSTSTPPVVVGTTTTTNLLQSRPAQQAAQQPRQSKGRFGRKQEPVDQALAVAERFLQEVPGVGADSARRLASQLLTQATKQGWKPGPELLAWLTDDPKGEVRRWANVLPARIRDLPRYRPGLVRLPGQETGPAPVATCPRCADAASIGLRPGQIWGHKLGPDGEPVDVAVACKHEPVTA